jgi:tetratricopeptide (TPR) repeat protein
MELRGLALLALAACVPQTKRLVIPDDMRKVSTGPTVAASAGSPSSAAPGAAPGSPASAAAAAAAKAPGAVPALLRPQPPAAAPAPKPPDQRYVLRLVEHGRVWEVELPEQTGGYEVRIPIGPQIEAPTAADAELLGKDPKDQKPLPPRSFLTGMAKIGEMYSSHRYELALIEAVDLSQQYPKEPRIEAMKGSLYQKLGKTELAREAWKKALELDPSDVVVAEALRGLKGE